MVLNTVKQILHQLFLIMRILKPVYSMSKYWL